MRRLLFTLLLLVLVLLPQPAKAARILELCEVDGVRENQLVGYGLVVGLNNTGDSGQARFTLQSTAAMLRRLGATVDPAMIQTRNAAAVMVTATLPPSSNPGTHLDVTVSSLGNARSLSGGTLLQTPLYGADRNVYAVAQGAVLLGGFGASGASGSSVSRNHLTAGRVPEGGIVERRVDGNGLPTEGPLVLTLRSPSFITARRIVEAIDGSLGDGVARARDSGTVEIAVPDDRGEDRVGLLAEIQVLEVEPENRARVVIDERTGTVVVGAHVRIREVAIAQGGLTVAVSETPAVSQPNAVAEGETTVVPQSDVEATAEAGALQRVGPTASLQDVVNALNALGATPRDLISIFQALRTAGALDAEIEVQ
ncbi:MAG: flagellar basal body P-ring protein FlgI [Sandaracinaceae bacterium]